MIPRHVLAVEREALAGLESNRLTTGKPSSTNAVPFEVLEDGYPVSCIALGLADAPQQVFMVSERPMGEVEAKYTHSCLDHLVQCLGVCAGRADRGDDARPHYKA